LARPRPPPPSPTRRPSDLTYRGHFRPEYGRHNKVCAGVDEPLGSVGVEYRTDAHDEILVLARMGEQFGKHIVSIATAVCEFKYRSEEHTSELQSRENLVCR